MRSSSGKLFLLALLAAVPACPAAAGSGGARSFRAALAEAGLEYAGARTFSVSRNYRRGDWSGALPAFWTLDTGAGAVRLRLELTKNISRAQAEKTMAERFLRIDALYAGGAAYPGMITTEFEVPPQLRPRDLRTGPGENKVKVLAATPSMAYGAGSEDLVSRRGLLGYVYCEKNSLLAQIELFFPKKDFDQESALGEFDKIRCAVTLSGFIGDKVAAGSKEK
ncbi:MAG: hypothetical protein NTY45_08505 [Elusimicrobia bacterium]|nr:hypothetical protein [Elusimicrobiota bacterium]